MDLLIKRKSDGEVLKVWKYVLGSPSQPEEHIWCNDWYGHHIIGVDCEWFESNVIDPDWINIKDQDKPRDGTKYSAMENPKCVTGCINFYGGEIKHHPSCPYYPESLSKLFDDLKAEYTILRDKCEGKSDNTSEKDLRVCENNKTSGTLTFSPMKGKPGHCFAAQVWDHEDKCVAVIESRLGEEKSTEYARIFAAAPKMLDALVNISEYWNRDNNDKAMSDALYHIIETAEEAIQEATKPLF